MPAHGTADQVELRVGRTTDVDQLDAAVGLRTGTAGIEHAHIGLAVSVAGDHQLVGQRAVIAQVGVEQQGAARAIEAVDGEGVEGAGIAQCHGAGAAQRKVAEVAVAGHQPGAVAVDAGAGDIDEAAVDLRLVTQGDVQAAIDRGGVEADIARKPRIIHVERYVAGTGCGAAAAGIDLQQIAVAAQQLGAIADVDDEVRRLVGRHTDGGAAARRDRGAINHQLQGVWRAERAHH